MSLKVCTAEFMISDSSGMGFASSWLPTLVAERMAVSGRDGEVDRAPDQVPFIDSEILWTNNTDDTVHVMVSVHRASRSILSSSPNTLVLDDAWTSDIGVSPSAPAPAGTSNGVGARIKTRRSYQSLIFSRIFRDYADWLSYVEVGAVDPGETVHFRYRCLFSTPGEWRTAVQPRYEAHARYTRLRMWTAPWTTGVI
jgi:hypothetical protein